MIRQEAADRLVTAALDLVVMVRDEDPNSVGLYLAGIDRTRLEHLAIALAALTPDDKPVSELLAWCDPNHRPRRAYVRDLADCGTHSAFTRHKAAGEEPCDLCREGERTYQREHKRRIRGTQPEAYRVAS